MEWLRRVRIAQPGALLGEEVFLHGKRIDLVLLSRSGILSTFELKTSHTASVLHQALLNSLSADRSYVVTAVSPSKDNLEYAAEIGIGWLVIRDGRVRQVLRSRRQLPVPEARTRLLNRIRSVGVRVENVQ